LESMMTPKDLAVKKQKEQKEADSEKNKRKAPTLRRPGEKLETK
jgi:hypothetical protein